MLILSSEASYSESLRATLNKLQINKYILHTDIEVTSQKSCKIIDIYDVLILYSKFNIYT
jgi:hypothetical protein